MNAFHHSSAGTGATRTVSAAAVQFVAGDFSAPTSPYARVQVQDDDVYATYDATVPSVTNGEIITAGTAAYFLLRDLLAMKFVRVTGDARVFVQPANLVSPSTAAGL